MKTINDLKPGDTVWWTDVNRKGVHSGTVTKAGRLLITVGGVRGYVFRKDTGRSNDGYSHQSLIPDLEAYQARVIVDGLFKQIKDPYRRLPAGVTADDIRAAAKLLQIELNDPEVAASTATT